MILLENTKRTKKLLMLIWDSDRYYIVEEIKSYLIAPKTMKIQANQIFFSIFTDWVFINCIKSKIKMKFFESKE